MIDYLDSKEYEGARDLSSEELEIVYALIKTYDTKVLIGEALMKEYERLDRVLKI
jgi:hypothetical protein